MVAFTARLPDLRRLSLGRESFAVHGPLALLGNASYPVSVRQPAVSFPASFSTPVALGALRFPWIVTTNSPEDFHLQVTRHAGHTVKKGAPLRTRPLSRNRAPCYLRWLLTCLVISNIETRLLPPNTFFSLSSATIIRRSFGSCRLFFLMYAQIFFVTSVRGCA
jgi:hypothetical protein